MKGLWLARSLEEGMSAEEKKEQEQQTRELTLQASRSELKALRAQINPHFLFNALNAIAGLIHKDLGIGTEMALGYSRWPREGNRERLALFQVGGITPAAGYTSTVIDLGKFAQSCF